MSDTQTPHYRAVEAAKDIIRDNYEDYDDGSIEAAIQAYLDLLAADPEAPMTLQPVAPAQDVNAELLRALNQSAAWFREFEAMSVKEAKRYDLPTDAALNAAWQSNFFKTCAIYLETAIANATKGSSHE